VKELLRANPPDRRWPADIRELRDALRVEDRAWTRLILDTTVLVTVERSVATSLDAVIEALASGRAKERRRAFVEDVLSTIPIEPYDPDVARGHASLLAHTRRRGRPRGAHDLLIAATALAHGRTVVLPTPPASRTCPRFASGRSRKGTRRRGRPPKRAHTTGA
jgi:tRNA(fMet)-specific endonuclease VapC